MANVVLKKSEGHTKEEIGEAVSKALELLDYDFGNGVGARPRLVVIKPNLCYYWDYSTGETVDPRVVSAVIDWIRQKFGNEVEILVAEADASAMRTKYAFKILGYEKLRKEKNVELVNLSEGEIVSREVEVAGEKFVFPVNKLILKADLILNVPKIKSHRVVGFTCALKNMFGAIAKPRKHVYHSKLAQAIVGINKIIKSNLILVDGMIAGGKTPKKIGVIIAGDDCLATDLVVAEGMNHNPLRISYLKLAMKEKIGAVDNITLIENPVRLEDIQQFFPKPNYALKNLSWKMQLKMLKLYTRISRDVTPPILEE